MEGKAQNFGGWRSVEWPCYSFIIVEATIKSVNESKGQVAVPLTSGGIFVYSL